MTTLIKAKSFDTARVSFEAPKHILANNFIIPLRYDGHLLAVQLPRTVVRCEPYDAASKWYIDLMTPRYSALHTFVAALARQVRARTASLRGADGADAHFADNITAIGDGFVSLRLKLPRRGNVYQTDVVDADGKRLTPFDLKPGMVALCICSIESAYCLDDKSGFALNLTTVRVA